MLYFLHSPKQDLRLSCLSELLSLSLQIFKHFIFLLSASDESEILVQSTGQKDKYTFAFLQSASVVQGQALGKLSLVFLGWQGTMGPRTLLCPHLAHAGCSREYIGGIFSSPFLATAAGFS